MSSPSSPAANATKKSTRPVPVALAQEPVADGLVSPDPSHTTGDEQQNPGPGQKLEVRQPTAPPAVVLPPARQQVEGQPSEPLNTPPEFRPQSPLELLWWFLDTMKWSRTSQLLLLLTVPLAVVLAGLGLLAHVIVGTSAFWSAISGMAAAGGTGAVTYGAARRRKRRRREAQDQDAGNTDDPGPDQQDE